MVEDLHSIDELARKTADDLVKVSSKSRQSFVIGKVSQTAICFIFSTRVSSQQRASKELVKRAIFFIYQYKFFVPRIS